MKISFPGPTSIRCSQRNMLGAMLAAVAGSSTLAFAAANLYAGQVTVGLGLLVLTAACIAMTAESCSHMLVVADLSGTVYVTSQRGLRRQLLVEWQLESLKTIRIEQDPGSAKPKYRTVLEQRGNDLGVALARDYTTDGYAAGLALFRWLGKNGLAVELDAPRDPSSAFWAVEQALKARVA